jgi:uncharacterized protein YndB with AHSA1/START domain
VVQRNTSEARTGRNSIEPLEIIRTFDAPRTLVYQMWAIPDHLRKWSAPKGYTIPAARTDFREGGDWYARMYSSDGEDHRVQGTYREIVDGRRIVLTHAWLDAAGRPETETLITVQFDDEGSKTKMTFVQDGFDTEEARNGIAIGWNECFDQLGAHLAHFAGPA